MLHLKQTRIYLGVERKLEVEAVGLFSVRPRMSAVETEGRREKTESSSMLLEQMMNMQRVGSISSPTSAETNNIQFMCLWNITGYHISTARSKQKKGAALQ